MIGCKRCKDNEKRMLFKCPDCGALYCEECGESNKRICQNCYSNLDFNS